MRTKNFNNKTKKKREEHYQRVREIKSIHQAKKLSPQWEII